MLQYVCIYIYIYVCVCDVYDISYLPSNFLTILFLSSEAPGHSPMLLPEVRSKACTSPVTAPVTVDMAMEAMDHLYFDDSL